MSQETLSLFDFQPDRVVAGHFRIVKPQRQSGLSTAFEALDERATGAAARCALVLFPGALFEGAKQAEEFRAAWKPWTAVRSAHVAGVREILAMPHHTTLLVTDLAEGLSLREWLKTHKRMTAEQTLALGRGLLDGLAAIHAQGLVHGDIKPQTIFVTERKGQLHGVLVDGGITTGLWSAKHLGEHTALIGTPYYAPVEQFGGESPDVQSDVYNLATVLFECAAGVLPWPGSTMLEVFQAKLDRSAPSIKRRAPKVQVPEGFERAVVQGLLADKRQRYPSAAEFRDALAAVHA